MRPRARRPLDWPSYMSEKRLAGGVVAYYWAPPSWAKARGCPIQSEALGTDYAAAKKRCDDVLNLQFRSWRTGSSADPESGPAVGTFDWLRLKTETTPRFRRRGQRIQKADRTHLARAADYVMKDGRRFGAVSLKSITPGSADRLIEKLGVRDDGSAISRTAVAIATACRSAWDWVRRDHPTVVPALNPFSKMGLEYRPKKTRPVTFDELTTCVAACDKAGAASIGTAAMISWFWMMRQTDVLSRFDWTKYRPADNPQIVRVWHHKTGEEVDVPLYDEDGTALWPELMERLDATERRGTLVVMRDSLDRRRKAYLPWGQDYFRHRVGELRAAAGIDSEAKFMGLRHGGQTAAADAGLTDAQLRALAGHKTANITVLYAQGTMKQRAEGARKMLNARTKRGNLSE